MDLPPHGVLLPWSSLYLGPLPGWGKGAQRTVEDTWNPKQMVGMALNMATQEVGLWANIPAAAHGPPILILHLSLPKALQSLLAQQDLCSLPGVWAERVTAPSSVQS